jgi:hypothetical protein
VSTSEPSSSFLPSNLPETGSPPEPEGPSEALDAPESDSRVQDVQTPQAIAKTSQATSEAVLAFDEAARAADALWTDLEPEFNRAQVREAAREWRKQCKSDKVPTAVECLQVVHLAIRYAAVYGAKGWGHLFGEKGTLPRWAASGWSVGRCEMEVRNHEPKPKRATPPPATKPAEAAVPELAPELAAELAEITRRVGRLWEEKDKAKGEALRLELNARAEAILAGAGNDGARG